MRIEWIESPEYFRKHPSVPANFMDLRNDGYSKLQQWGLDERLVIKDAADSPEWGFAKNMLQYYRNKYPDRKIIYIVDNFMKFGELMEISAAGRIDRRHVALLNDVKNTMTKLNMGAWCTVEYTKLANLERPTKEKIAETKAFQYDAIMISHVFNPFSENPVKAYQMTWRDSSDTFTSMDNGGIVDERPIKPVVEIVVDKNKKNGWLGSFFLKLKPQRASFEEVSIKEVKMYQESSKKLLSFEVPTTKSEYSRYDS